MSKKANKIRLGLIVLLVIITVILFYPKSPKVFLESNYAITSRVPFNQTSYYSLKQPIDDSLYQKTGTWVGRLILPTEEEINSNNSKDWVWLEVYNAPNEHKNLMGKKVLLTWQNNPLLEAYVKLVTTDIKFTEQAKQGLLEGNVLPTRLNGRLKVGPLQSLAGARPKDDVIVSLEKVKVVETNQITLQITTVPLQVTGRFYGLVKVIKPTPSEEIPPACPGISPCPSQLYEVIHYNKKSGQFDGIKEIIRLPQQPIGRNGRFNSTPQDLEKSPANQTGWYIYGAKDQKGIFTVEAIKPRGAFQIKPNRLLKGKEAGLNYLKIENWQNTPEQKGKLETVQIEPKQAPEWKEGESALVIHVFGGIGGKKGELGFLTLPTGHFSYGVAKVVREPLTGELQFDIEYHQVYAHNPEGIIAGRTSYSTYAGNLQRGWLGTRPISDVLIRLDWLNDYPSFNAQINPLNLLLQQTEVMMARYRTGDGTGISVVSPSTSCVQDSIQAFYIAMQLIKKQILAQPTTTKTKQFIALVDDLDAEIVPFGIVRPDWQENLNTIAGVHQPDHFLSIQRLWTGLLSWQSMIPRRAADQMTQIFLDHQAVLYFIRTNQIGGWQPDIYPVAPTLINGLPLVSTLLTRLILAVKTPITASTWWIMVQTALIYAIIALPMGLASGFLRPCSWETNIKTHIFDIFRVIFFPALSEEIFFRVLLIPHRLEKVTESHWLMWAVFSLILFILYHPANAVTFYRRGNPTFFEPMFLLLAALLGIACTITYALTGSLMPGVIVHWFAVIVWLFILGGYQKLSFDD